jgi:predicted PhzF superfamily epimerase YddE/YHI9
MAVRFTQVDAFTAIPFTGNPAAVVVLGEPREDLWMQAVAREMNLSETAFLVWESDAFRLRWFTPAVEVSLCGHATLASAHVLWEDGFVPDRRPLRFLTRSGLLGAVRHGEWVELDFPARPEQPVEAPAGLAAALGAAPRYVGRNVDDLVVLLDDEASVRGLRPSFSALLGLRVRGVTVTAPATTPGYDFVSRFFAPAVGVDEDPVTGSAHCCLAPFWRQRLGKDEMVGYQASPRGGVVRVRVAGERVILGGQAVTVARGELLA